MLRLEAREALGAGEQTTLFALLAIAGSRWRSRIGIALLQDDALDAVDQQLWSALDAQSSGDGDCGGLRFSTTWSEVCRVAGSCAGGDEVAMRQTHVKRLCAVTAWEYRDGQRAPVSQSRLMSWVLADDQRVHLALNARLLQALIGTPYASVSLIERMALQSDTTRVLHAALSTLVRPGKYIRVHLETLCRRLWPDWDGPLDDGTRRRRRSNVRHSLEAIGQLDGWMVRLNGTGPYIVRRQPLTSTVRETSRPRGNDGPGTTSRERPVEENPREINELEVVDASHLFITKA